MKNFKMPAEVYLQKLLEKELVLIAGRKEDAVGKPLIYTTSKNFMDYFGINSPEDLPKIKEVLMEELVEATKVEHNEVATDEVTANDITNGTTNDPVAIEE